MKKKRDYSAPLLMQETPVLSDEMPPSPVKEAAPSSSYQQQQQHLQQQQSQQSQQSNKKKFGLKRLFSKKKKGTSQEQPEQQQQHSLPAPSMMVAMEKQPMAVPTTATRSSNKSSVIRSRSQKSNDRQREDDDLKSEASSHDSNHNYEDDWAVNDLLGVDANASSSSSILNDHEDTTRNTSTSTSSPMQQLLVANNSTTSSPQHNAVLEKNPSDLKLQIPDTPRTSSIKTILSRPFGREHVDKSFQTWSILVSSAEWETDERHWKYRIQLFGKEDGILQASTFRSLADFAWLQQALLQEYGGGLLLPTLSISLGVPDLESAQHEVDSKLLQQWLSDVLHGVRGQGELFFRPEKHGVELLKSESMEAFWYRTEKGPLSEGVLLDPILTSSDTPRNGIGGNAEDTDDSQQDGSLWSNWTVPEMCIGCQPAGMEVVSGNNNNTNNNNTLPKRKKAILKLGMVQCASRALGDAESLDIQDSFVEYSSTFDKGFQPSSSSLAIHSELVHAEKELCWNWRTRALTSMEKLRILQEQEKHVGSAWKRFAISVSNLFSYEKDVESARLGDSKARRELQMPYRKLQKSAVDDCLRVLARSKFERSTPALESVSGMLAAFVADLSAVQPSVEAYGLGVQQLSLTQRQLFLQQQKLQQQTAASKVSVASTSPSMKPQSLVDQIQATLTQVQRLAGATVASQNDTDADYQAQQQQQQQHRDEQMQQRVQAMEFRVLQNEALLKDSLTCLCKATVVRTSRMAYRYFNVEAMQTATLYSAAVEMRQKISVATKESLAKMIHRHAQETKEDHATEVALVQRIVNLGNIKRFSESDDNTEVVDGHEIDTDVDNEQAHRAKLRDGCLTQCRQRIGRWDSKLALAIMEAVGVDDANVRVEETTRDLRMVRKYAIGLRENVQRCSEALDILRMSILQGGLGDIRDIRHDFMSELQTIFSSKYSDDSKPSTPKKKSESPSRGVLSGAGINLTDPAGWTRIQKGSCGESCQTYMDCRESGTEWLLESLGELLKEYNQRVESIESFVYMECVGIQLEKHFSQSRGTALAAFEKRTDITSAINIATRKRMPMLVQELQTKLENVDPNVSHTTVKWAKEAHLESKTLKAELHELSDRRLTRARETSTERVIALLAVWSKEEEGAASAELKVLKNIIKTMERAMSKNDITAYLNAAPIPKIQTDV